MINFNFNIQQTIAKGVIGAMMLIASIITMFFIILHIAITHPEIMTLHLGYIFALFMFFAAFAYLSLCCKIWNLREELQKTKEEQPQKTIDAYQKYADEVLELKKQLTRYEKERTDEIARSVMRHNHGL